MTSQMIKIAAALTSFIFLAGCSGKAPVQHKRGQAFFNKVLNPGEKFDRAEQEMPNLKVLTSNQRYKMSYALFDNGKFYYQVHNLGNGTGTWSFQNGSIHLLAPRNFFDLELNLAAAAEQGEGMAFQFLDRFGNNVVKVEFRDKPL